MKIEKALTRDRKKTKRKNGMKRDGDSVKVIQKIIEKRASLIKKKYREGEDEIPL